MSKKSRILTSFLLVAILLLVILPGAAFAQGQDPWAEVFDANGNLVEPQITLPPNAQAITVASDGTVSYTVPGQTASQTAGQIQLANFINPAGLNTLGQNLYQPTNASGDPVFFAGK